MAPTHTPTVTRTGDAVTTDCSCGEFHSETSNGQSTGWQSHVWLQAMISARSNTNNPVGRRWRFRLVRFGGGR